MKIAIPQKSNIISKIADAENFAIVIVEDGSIKNIDYVESLDKVLGKAEYFVVNNSNEEVDEMYDYSIQVLKTPMPEMNIDEIIEAFMFRELYEL
jgi:predicted Fe-Mo cluster-binding NifX family protein